MWCCHYLPPGSLHTLGASESLSYNHVSFEFISNGLHGKNSIQTYMDEIYKHAFHVCAIWGHTGILMNYFSFNLEPYYSGMCVYHQFPQTLAKICRNMAIFCSFRAVADTEKCVTFILLIIRQHCFRFACLSPSHYLKKQWVKLEPYSFKKKREISMG